MDAILEAKRHIDNAKSFLSNNAKKEDGFYQDRKYIKIAGHTAYTGILLALDELLKEKRRKPEKVLNGIKRNYPGLIQKLLPILLLHTRFYI